MCHISCILFGAKNLAGKEVHGKKVIELGACVVNGSLRPLIESYKPAKYVGIDIKKGPGVDVVCDAADMPEKFGRESFDVVILTEFLEHVKDWRAVISNIKNICRPGGIMLITTRSHGFFYHGYPNDFWRYEPSDIEEIFSDCEITVLEKDPEAPGIFAKVRKPKKFVEKDLTDYKLYSIVANNRVKEISGRDFRSLYFLSLFLKDKLRNLGVSAFLKFQGS